MESQIMSLAPPTSVDSTEHAIPDFKRPIVNFSPSIWGNVFLQYDSQSMEINGNMKQQVEMEKEEVKKMFLFSRNDIEQKLNFIDSLQRLGISYHFEREIDEALEQIHNTFTNNKEITTKEGSLRFLALAFRLLRQNRYQLSAELFEKFKNNKGNFNEKLFEDVQGMWNLYEAAQLKINGEDILNEALDFTFSNLSSLITNQLSPFLARQIRHCLKTPLHKGVPRLETRCYISSYSEEPSHIKILLNFAKLDFNMLQKMHQKELGSITKWWKKSDFATEVPYARDRVAEAYFWPLAMSYEPKYANSRKIVGKLVACISLLDDTYDAYGAVEELELFTQAIQSKAFQCGICQGFRFQLIPSWGNVLFPKDFRNRKKLTCGYTSTIIRMKFLGSILRVFLWDFSLIQSLPNCMKVVFNTTVELWDEIEMMLAETGKSNLVLQYIKEEFYKLAQSYLVETKWCNEGFIPTYDEYKANGIISSTLPLQIISFLGFGEFSNKELFDWIFSDPKIIEAVSTIGRLADDISSHKFEQQRVHVASAVECCMKQYDISREEAYKLIQIEIEDYWIIMNEECLKIENIPKSVLEIILNVARITEFTYENFEDKYTKAELMKDYIIALLIDPIRIEQCK